MGAIPEFSLALPPRCHEPLGVSLAASCGEIAGWMRLGRGTFDVAYFCDVHRQAADVALPGSFVFRRLHLAADIWIATASRLHGAAQLEAYARLERYLGMAGAVMEVQSVLSTYGRFTCQPSLRNAGRVLDRE